jgi:phosphoenolpyruvate synthase/pyruvate phosphate dikinase
VQVYGNVSDRSGTGVCFSRNPATGERVLFGEFLMNAQVGEGGSAPVADWAGKEAQF